MMPHQYQQQTMMPHQYQGVAAHSYGSQIPGLGGVPPTMALPAPTLPVAQATVAPTTVPALDPSAGAAGAEGI
jgi:hypothetical protein